MAQVVGLYENNVTFTEGPFVIVNANGWRIEAELKGHYCPVLPTTSIFKIVEGLGLLGKTNDKDLAVAVCDVLNRMVLAGEIVLAGKVWVDRDSVIRAQEKAKRIMDEIY